MYGRGAWLEITKGKLSAQTEMECIVHRQNMVNIPLPRYPLYQGPRNAHLWSCDVDTSFL